MSISAYLDHYAEPETQIVNSFSLNKYDRCLVIPCFNENWEEVKNIWQHLRGKWIVILVINAPDNTAIAGDSPARCKTRELLKTIEIDTRFIEQHKNISLRSFQNQDLIVIDRCSAGLEIPRSQGVGLARKIGADVCLSLVRTKIIRQPVIYTTDADASLPAGYGEVPLDKNTAAAVHAFEHESAPGLEKEILLYEIYLYAYVDGLSRAGSPFAFHTIGSTLAINVKHYAQVRGFPKKSAGEDFYLLNKLAKTGDIARIKKPKIMLSGRISDRVIFGTGAAINNLRHMDNPVQDYLFYNPEVFFALKSLLSLQPVLYSKNLSQDMIKDLPKLHANILLSWAEENRFNEIISKGRKNSRSETVFRQFFHGWMDGFRTMRFIHYARDNGIVSVKLGEYLEKNQVPFTTNPSDNCFSLQQLVQIRNHLRDSLERL